MRVCQGEGEGGLTLCMGAMGRFPLPPPYIICCLFCLYSLLHSQPHELHRYAGFQKCCLSQPPQENRYAGSQDVACFLYISPSKSYRPSRIRRFHIDYILPIFPLQSLPLSNGYSGSGSHFVANLFTDSFCFQQSLKVWRIIFLEIAISSIFLGPSPRTSLSQTSMSIF